MVALLYLNSKSSWLKPNSSKWEILVFRGLQKITANLSLVFCSASLSYHIYVVNTYYHGSYQNTYVSWYKYNKVLITAIEHTQKYKLRPTTENCA